VLVKHSADDLAMGWSPDGRYVLFSSDRTGSASFWLIPVAKGKAAGEPILVRRDAEQAAAPMGFTSDGALMYGANRSFSEIHVATIDPTTGKMTGQPTRLLDSFLGLNLGVDWSPDGSELAYVRQTGTHTTGRLLVVRTLATGIERVVPVKLNYLNVPRWTPDGRGLVMRARDLKGRDGYYVIDAATGESKVLVETNLFQFAGWAHDGNSSIYRVQDLANRAMAIVKRDVASGDATDVFRLTIGAGNQVAKYGMDQAQASPDGRLVAFALRTDTSRSTLNVVSTDGGQLRELYRSSPGQYVNTVAWSADGRHVFFTQRAEPSAHADSVPLHILRIPAAGGAPEETGIAMEGITQIRVHPDGKHIGFNGGIVTPAEVWVMEKFLPKAEGANKRSR
jgi:Tol biopolymer transport system component